MCIYLCNFNVFIHFAECRRPRRLITCSLVLEDCLQPWLYRLRSLVVFSAFIHLRLTDSSTTDDVFMNDQSSLVRPQFVIGGLLNIYLLLNI